jgi:CarD family transcriptional regulator
MIESTTFAVNQKIVYPSQGVGKILDIKERSFKNEMIRYYVIYLAVSDMTVMVPVSKAEELGIRAIVSPDESRRALDLISEEFEPIPSDWKLRYQINLDLLKKGSVIDIATIVRSLYHRSKIKELPILERKLYDSARKLLEDEITYSLDIPREEVENLIHTHLEPFGAVTPHAVKDIAAILDDDDDLMNDEVPQEEEEDESDDLED